MSLRLTFVGGVAVFTASMLLCWSFVPAQDRPQNDASDTTRDNSERRAPETLLPADPILYVGWDGEEAHREAWEKTAEFRALQSSGLMPFVEKTFATLGENASNEEQAIFRDVMDTATRNGVSVAVTTPVAEGPALPWGVLVLHGGGDLVPRISTTAVRILQNQPDVELQSVERAGRTIGMLRFSQFPPGEVGLWAEDGHLVVAAGVQAIDNALAVFDGKAKNITTSRLWSAYREGDQPFDSRAAAWLDFEKLAATLGPVPVPVQGADRPVTVQNLLDVTGLNAVKAFVLRLGYQGPATVSDLRIEMQPERTGLAALAMQEPISLDSLPPLPAGISGFNAASFDFSRWYDTGAESVRGLSKLGITEAAQQFERALGQANEWSGLDPKSDVLDPLGNVICMYNDPSQGPLILGLTITVSVDDAAKLRTSIDTLLDRLGQQFPPDQFNVRRTEKHGRTVVTLEIANAAANPSFVVTDDWLAVSIVPQNLETFLLRTDGKLPVWTPDEKLAAAFDGLPKEFTTLRVSDPRETYRLLAGLAPIVLPIVRAGVKTEHPDLSLEAAVADLPPAALVVEPLFPNVSVTYVDGDAVVTRSRSSLPSFLGGDSGSIGVGTTAVAVALLLPAVQAARTAARRTQSKNHLKQIVLALHNYHVTSNEFPAGTVEGSARKTEDRLSWMASILPHLDQGALSRQLDEQQAWNQGANLEAAATAIPVLLNPSVAVTDDPDQAAKTHYAGIGGVGKNGPTLPVTSPKAGVFAYNRAARLGDVVDGSSNTLMVTEVTGPSAGPWAQGGKSTIRAFTAQPYVNGPDGIGGPFAGGFNAALVDGSVRFLSDKTDPEVLEALSTINGGEVIDPADLND